MLKIKILAAVKNTSLQIGFYASASALLQATDGQKEGSILFVRRLKFVPFKRIRKAERDREKEREEIHPSRNLRLPFFSAPLTLFFTPSSLFCPFVRIWWQVEIGERERERERERIRRENPERQRAWRLVILMPDFWASFLIPGTRNWLLYLLPLVTRFFTCGLPHFFSSVSYREIQVHTLDDWALH